MIPVSRDIWPAFSFFYGVLSRGTPTARPRRLFLRGQAASSSPVSPLCRLHPGLRDGGVGGRRRRFVRGRGAVSSVHHVPPQAHLCPVHPGRRLRVLRREERRKVTSVRDMSLGFNTQVQTGGSGGLKERRSCRSGSENKHCFVQQIRAK